jgi:glycosyltransferase involved in cell wall biosynthesis
MTKFLSRNQKNYDFCLIRTLTFPAILIGALKAMKIVQLRTWITAETGGPNDDISTIKRSRLRRIFTFCISRHNYLNSICEDNYRHYIELGLPKNKLTQIYNGIESEIYAKSSYPTKINNFLYLGRLSKTKGVCELLAAFKAISTKHPDKKLYIGGDGTEKEAIIDYIAKNKLEKNISYEGYIDKLQKDAFYRKGECLILPSYSEGFPIVILEATIRKKAIISTSVSDLKKLFGDKIIFCQKRSASDLSDKIELALGKDFNSPIYDNIVSQIDIKVVAKKITDLFT